MLDCIVIGAGPGGLVSTKELLEQGISEVVCLEQAQDLGGVFANTYDSLTLTSSATMSMFSDFWIGDGNQHKFWTKKEAVDYWNRYARHFGVYDRIQFRLRGPGKKESLARELLIKLPVIIPTPIIKASLKGVLGEGLKLFALKQANKREDRADFSITRNGGIVKNLSR